MTEDNSVMVDEGQNVSDGEDYSNEEDSQELDNQVDSQETGDDEEDGSGDEQLTDKGTKLDPNPKSAVHQQLANANRVIRQMEGILTNPALLKRYAEQNGMTLAEAKADVKEQQDEVEDAIQEFTPDQFKTSADVAKALNDIRSTTSKTIKELKAENSRLREGYQGINSSRKLETIANNMDRDITTVREKYPELNPKSPDFDKELEQSIGELYNELDFDPATQTFRGQVSLAKIADRVMKAAKRAGQRGSRKAQTDVKVKQAGKVTSGQGKSKSSGDTQGLTIAQKIAKAYGNG